MGDVGIHPRKEKDGTHDDIHVWGDTDSNDDHDNFDDDDIDDDCHIYVPIAGSDRGGKRRWKVG